MATANTKSEGFRFPILQGVLPIKGSQVPAEVLAGLTLAALLSLFAAGLDRMQRMEQAAQQLIVEKEIVDRIASVNPVTQPTGEGYLGDWRYTWKARPQAEFKRVTDYFDSEAPTRHVALFVLDIEIEQAGGKSVTLAIKKMGWRS